MNGDIEIEKRINVSTEDMLFIDDIISENKIIINVPLIDVVGNDLTRAAMLTRYMFFYKHNNYQEFSLPDKKMAEYLHTNLKTVERQKRWLKENGLISVRKVGLPAIGLITVNISIIRERYTFEESRTLKMRVLEPLKRGDIYNNIEERDIREKENTKRNPASGSPSSPDVDESHLAEEVFENRFWSLVPNKIGKQKCFKLFLKITNKGKSEAKISELIEGYKRYLSFLAKNKDNNFNRRPKDPATFLNVENKLWLESWEFVEEEPAKKETTTQIKQPKDLERRIGIARKLKLLDSFLPEEYNREWKFIPKEVKEIIVSEDVEKVIKDIKSNEETLITQIACVTMMGRDGYMTWKDKYEEETGERPTYDLEFYIPFGKKLPNDIWKWLLKYSHNFGLPSERKIDEARQWYYKSDHSAAWNLFA